MRQDAFSKCHPVVNFIYFLGAIGFAVVIQHPAYIAASCIAAGVYCLILQGRKAYSLLMGLIPLFLLLSMINPLFNTDGETCLFFLLGRPYTLEALLYGMATAGIFAAMLLWFGCYSKVLTSDKFVALFGGLIPSMSLLLVMVLRMIPNLARKAQQILNARKSIGKGAGQDTGAWEKLQDGVTILSALTDWALEGSIVTADSMRSRGYGCGKRSTYQIYRMQPQDYALLFITVMLALAVVFSGNFSCSYTPVLQIPSINRAFAAYCGYLLIPIALHTKEAITWHISISRI